jgi:leader peptidase (prepilin peptidase)/N-methyltransferase
VSGTPAFAGLAAVVGLPLGSYAVTHGLRWSQGEGSIRGRSHCDACGRPLGALETIPLLSYAYLRGACAACGGAIDPVHLAGEAAGALVLASAVWVAAPDRALLISLLGLTLIAAAAVDLKVQRLPDLFTATVAALGLALSVLKGPGAAAVGLAAAAAATGVLLIVRRRMAPRLGDPGLGLGDVKLVGALALWLGLGTAFMILLAALFGLAVALATPGRHARLAFGPMLAAGGWIVGVAIETGWRPWA